MLIHRLVGGPVAFAKLIDCNKVHFQNEARVGWARC